MTEVIKPGVNNKVASVPFVLQLERLFPIFFIFCMLPLPKNLENWPPGKVPKASGWEGTKIFLRWRVTVE